ncbi:hypothetical protein [Nocardia sp. NPDC003345]
MNASNHATHTAHHGHGGHGAGAPAVAPVTHAGQHTHHDTAAQPGHDAGAHAGHGASLPGGLQITQDGYTLDLLTPVVEPGEIDFRFRILGPDGEPVTDYTPIHDRELHLIVVRRELTGFWHVHPRRADDGTWSVRLNLPDAGAYRVFTDIAPRALGRTLTLGADLAVPGRYAPLPVPTPARTVETGGYEVELRGDLLTGAGDLLTLTVRRDGAAVTDLEPYLAAYGHLVVIRAGDLAYIHVHPTGEPGDGVTAPGPEIAFHTAVPGPGIYRLFLDFRHEGVVQTAAFTLRAEAPRH